MKAYVVEKEALSHNIELLQKMANGVPIWAVLKGNGYGIGVLPLARHLAEAGIDHFCVTEVREAELLRENGFEDAAILMLRSTGDPAELNRLMDLRVILTIGSWETACAINAIAAERADVVEAHLKIDTGMGRYGFLPEDMNHILGVYREQKNIAVSGVYTHFNCAFGSKKLTHQEFETFRKTVSAIREAGFETGTVHCCNSSAFLRFPEMHCDGGITRFRDCLSLILRGLRGIFFRALPLVEVNGHKCRVVGQIGMLHIAVDVRGIECKPGDRVIVPINPLHVKGMKIQYR